MYRIILLIVCVILFYTLIRGWKYRREFNAATKAAKIRQSEIDRERIVEADFFDVGDIESSEQEK